jgi:hypothetical protein
MVSARSCNWQCVVKNFTYLKKGLNLDMEVHTCSPSTLETETGSSQVQGYITRPYLKILGKKKERFDLCCKILGGNL